MIYLSANIGEFEEERLKNMRRVLKKEENLLQKYFILISSREISNCKVAWLLKNGL